MKNIVVITLFLFLSVVGLNAQDKGAEKKQTDAKPVKKSNERPVDKTPKEPFEGVDVKKMAAQCVVFDTAKGSIELEMFPESAPETVRNFLNLTAIGAFDTTTFSRIVPGFIIQGGNIGTHEKRTNELTNRATRNIVDEPNLIKHDSGIVSMARGAEPDSGSSNFFILLSNGSHLDGTFAAFGRVVKGMDVVETINKMEVEGEKPKDPVRIKSAIVKPCEIKTDAEKAEDSTTETTLKPTDQ